MTKAEMVASTKEKLNISNTTKDVLINDTICLAIEFCNLKSDKLPDGMEPIVRRKVKAIMDYEAKVSASPMLNNSVYDVKSITEGDSSVTYNVTNDSSKDTIYDLSQTDMRALRKFRRLR